LSHSTTPNDANNKQLLTAALSFPSSTATADADDAAATNPGPFELESKATEKMMASALYDDVFMVSSKLYWGSRFLRKVRGVVLFQHY
jgi:hypothetical protein